MVKDALNQALIVPTLKEQLLYVPVLSETMEHNFVETAQQHWLLILAKIEHAIRTKVLRVIKIAINGFPLLEVLKVVYGMVLVDASLLKIALNFRVQ